MLGAKSERARIAAIHYLDHADDRASAKTIERSLSAPANVLEQSEAAATLSRWGDRDAIPLLQKLLVDPNPNTRIAGAKALVLLHAKESEKALARAAASDGSFAKPELERALAAVRRGDTDAGL